MPPNPLPPEADEDTQYYRRVLHELIDMGLDLARQVHDQAANPAEAPQDPTIAFDRIARTIRRTVMLAQKIAEPPRANRAAARKRILRDVEDAIQRTADGPKAEAIHAEFLERLDAPDLDEDIANRPVAEIVADICRDLGIAAPPGTRPWKRRTPEDIAALCERAAARGAAPPGRTQERRPMLL